VEHRRTRSILRSVLEESPMAGGTGKQEGGDVGMPGRKAAATASSACRPRGKSGRCGRRGEQRWTAVEGGTSQKSVYATWHAGPQRSRQGGSSALCPGDAVTSLCGGSSGVLGASAHMHIHCVLILRSWPLTRLPACLCRAARRHPRQEVAPAYRGVPGHAVSRRVGCELRRDCGELLLRAMLSSLSASVRESPADRLRPPSVWPVCC